MNTSRLPRVLQIGKFYAPHRGGIETHLQSLCGELRKHVDLRVVVASSEPGTFSRVDETIEGVRVRRVPAWLNLASAPICPAMVSEIRNSDADIVHLHLPNPSAILAYLASGHRKTLICSYHSDTVWADNSGTGFPTDSDAGFAAFGGRGGGLAKLCGQLAGAQTD